MTESPKPPPRQAPRSAAERTEKSAPQAAPAPVKESKGAAPPPPPHRSAAQPAAAPARVGSGTAPLPPTAMIPPAPPDPITPLSREAPRDTLAPSSFGVLGNKQQPAPAPTNVRPARAPLNTLGELEGASATATLRPPGAVPPPPRSLPQPSPLLDAPVAERAVDTPLPANAAFTPLAGNSGALEPRPFGPRPLPPAPAAMTAPATAAAPAPATDAALDSTLDMSGSASKKAAQAALIEQTRPSVPGAAPAARPPTPVPAPGLFIADEPLEPRPKQASLVTPERELLTRMRIVVLVLGGLLLMLAGALVVMILRRSEATTSRRPAASASAPAPAPPGCQLALPPGRISATIERSVPISAAVQADGSIALAIADTKTTATGWIYDPALGETKRQLGASAINADITHVTASEPLLVDHAVSELAFGQTLSKGLAIGVGPAGLLRRGDDGATGVVFTLPTGARVTAPRVVSLGGAHFVTFRQGGAEGRVMSGWLKADGSAFGQLSAVSGAPPNLGTPNAAALGDRAVALFSARADKSAPYDLYAAVAAPGAAPEAARKLALPSEGGGAIAPSLAELAPGRFLLQFTDGSVGHYQVHAVVLDGELKPLGPTLLVSAKGANAGQGTIVTTPTATVSFFIQTTAGHDELWGATLSCH